MNVTENENRVHPWLLSGLTVADATLSFAPVTRDRFRDLLALAANTDHVKREAGPPGMVQGYRQGEKRGRHT